MSCNPIVKQEITSEIAMRNFSNHASTYALVSFPHNGCRLSTQASFLTIFRSVYSPSHAGETFSIPLSRSLAGGNPKMAIDFSTSFTGIESTSEFLARNFSYIENLTRKIFSIQKLQNVVAFPVHQTSRPTLLCLHPGLRVRKFTERVWTERSYGGF